MKMPLSYLVLLAVLTPRYRQARLMAALTECAVSVTAALRGFGTAVNANACVLATQGGSVRFVCSLCSVDGSRNEEQSLSV